jgi:hypothetical protein
MSLDINLTNVQSKPIVVSTNQTAENDRVYHVVANATFTDPTGVEGRGFTVFIRNGNAVIGGINYTFEGTIIKRIFHSGSWINRFYSRSLSGNNADENLVNKSTNVNTDQASDTRYPSVKAVFDWATNLLSNKVDVVAGKGLSENDFTNTLKTKLDGIQAGAEVNVNADWNATSGDAQILNKPTIPSVSGLVPYTGATQDVDLGEHELKAGQVEFDQTPTGTAGVAVMRWNDADGTIDLGLKGGNVTLQLGQEQLVRVVNKTATNINLLEANYQAVRVTGAQGQRLKVDLAQATNDVLSAETIGLVTETINNNQEGFITTSGLVRGINTTGSLQGETWADGDVVYLSSTTAGRITNVKPSAPNHLVIIGYVVSAHATQGSIFVKVDNGYELNEIHNVAISTPLNNQSLVYETATTLWKNKALTTAEVADSSNKRYVTDAQRDAIAVSGTIIVTSGTSFTTPSNITTATKFDIILVGGGGGGAGQQASNQTAGGGGGGGLCEIFSLTGLAPSTSYICQIGLAGAGGASNTNGSDGGNTTLTIDATTYSAVGGKGGLTSGGGNLGGDGGTATNGTRNLTGQNGLIGVVGATSLSNGTGGSSPLGNGFGGAPTGANNSNGKNATGNGAGGSGAKGLAVTGGNGTNGIIIAKYYS